MDDSSYQPYIKLDRSAGLPRKVCDIKFTEPFSAVKREEYELFVNETQKKISDIITRLNNLEDGKKILSKTNGKRYEDKKEEAGIPDFSLMLSKVKEWNRRKEVQSEHKSFNIRKAIENLESLEQVKLI
jgi:hypothetical protein